MLPPGHIAGSFLTAEALLKITRPSLSLRQTNQLLAWGMFFGIAPDFDFFYQFAKSGSFKVDPKDGNHRFYPSHAPILWLIAGLVIFFASAGPFGKTFGLLLWLCSWSHFVLDSIQYGIMWLWPLDKKIYCLFPVTREKQMETEMQKAVNKNFFGYWITFLKEYASGLKISLICELVLVLVTLILNFKSLI